MNLLIPEACAVSVQSSKKHSELKARSASESFHPTLLSVCCCRRCRHRCRHRCPITLAREVGRAREKKRDQAVSDLAGKHMHIVGSLLTAIHTQRARRAKPCHNTGIKKKMFLIKNTDQKHSLHFCIKLNAGFWVE